MSTIKEAEVKALVKITDAKIIKELTDFINKSVKEEIELAKLREGIGFLFDIRGKEASALLGALGLSRTRGNFTQVDTLKFIGEKARTEKELYELILKEGAKNEARWINDRNKIRVTINKVEERLTGKAPKEEPASVELKAKVKALVNSK